ncbi:unnamed protein product [Spirodela intermedia]|uniref:Hydrophobic seed protein domain-containing protein n=1 Tax=Spirodela intermedia TaxID=51605 RepID=A0A7I8KKX7_SPIIN|nr:unnamed protein product [Spirodela intermedia]
MASNSQLIATFLVANLLIFTLVYGQPTPSPSLAPPPSSILTYRPNILLLSLCNLRFIIWMPNPLVNIPYCCAVIKELPSNNTATCLCLAAQANILGINISIPDDIKLLLAVCGLLVPIGFTCP